MKTMASLISVMIHKINFLLCKERGHIHWKKNPLITCRKTNAVCFWNGTKYVYALHLKMWVFNCYSGWCLYLPLGFERLIVDFRQLKKFTLYMEAVTTTAIITRIPVLDILSCASLI